MTHYEHLAVVNNVNNYLNVRDEPSTDGMIVGKLLKNSGADILEILVMVGIILNLVM